jgi:nesprin-1
VSDHEAYLDKYRQCSEWLAAAQGRFESCRDGSSVGARQDLIQRSAGLKDLLAEQPSATSLLNNTVELGEKLYPSTAMEGREAVRQQLQELQQTLETLYDGVSSTERELRAKLNRSVVILTVDITAGNEGMVNILCKISECLRY